MQLKKFKELKQLNLNEAVVINARVLGIRENTNKGITTIDIFDGYERSSFTYYGSSKILNKFIMIDSVYQLSGIAGGEKRRYFRLECAELIAITVDNEKLFYPERFHKINDDMIFNYNDSITLIKDEKLRQFVGYCLGIPTKGNPHTQTQMSRYKFFLNSWASIRYHDSYPGGYIAHISTMLKVLRGMELMYKEGMRADYSIEVDWDLLRAAVYLHDIGKPFTYSKSQAGGIEWRQGLNLNHSESGIIYMAECYAKFKGELSRDVFEKLITLVTEHMDSSRISTRESRILKSIDSLESAFADAVSTEVTEV